ncbi:MAG: hypothetical protein M1834_008334 [Cirrosporium novae-zelandiae]|nr:MAG: hypothetical protein M1834_008334 [Cirrosporium novae-zelandiae]
MSISTSSARKAVPKFACNRCHELKIKCPRQVSDHQNSRDQSCARCLRAGVSCIFSPSQRMGRPSKSVRSENHLKKRSRTDSEESQSSDITELANLEINTTWSSLQSPVDLRALQDFDDVLDQDCSQPQAPQLPQLPHISPLPPLVITPTSEDDFENVFDFDVRQYGCSVSASPTSNSIPVPPSGIAQNPTVTSDPEISGCFPAETSMETCIQRLSQLHLELYHCSQSINFSSMNATSKTIHRPAAAYSNSAPTIDTDHFPPITTAGANAGEELFPNIPNGSSDIDETFRASQTLIEVLHRLIHQSSSHSKSSKQLFGPSTLAAELMPRHFLTDISCPYPNAPDSSIVLLILIIYLHLLRIYEPIILTLSRHLQRLQQMPPTDSFTVSLPLPSIHFGSFVPAATSDLQFVLLAQLVSHLFEGIESAIRGYVAPAIGIEGSSTSTDGKGTAIMDAAELALVEIRMRERRVQEELRDLKTLVNSSTTFEN